MIARFIARVRTSVTSVVCGVLLCGAIVAGAANASHAGLLFSETFQYTVGSNLAGQNGGTGFSGAWSGGSSTIVAGLTSGSGSAVQVGTAASTRTMAFTASTSGTSTYITYLMNSSSFSGGNYTGLSLFNGGTEEMFMGIPWQAQKFGFDAHAGNGAADIKAIDFTPLTNTSYLVALGLVPSATPGKVDVKMWATSNLAIDPNTLVVGTPNASLLGIKNNFSFSSIRIAGDYAGSLKMAGIASSPNVSQAASVSVNAVPEPSTYAMALAGIACGGYTIWRRRTRA
ncbi:MAG: PEP-CTERM sorting domain-containing protein [Planctomycetia bacterium]|nr:PEP-CTERM sorting domain-containing protein [Planctomycetia bacterium]